MRVDTIVVVICLLLLLLFFSARKIRVRLGGKERPGRLLGAVLRIESGKDQKSLPFQSLSGIVERFDEVTNSYELKLEAPGSDLPASVST